MRLAFHGSGLAWCAQTSELSYLSARYDAPMAMPETVATQPMRGHTAGFTRALWATMRAAWASETDERAGAIVLLS